MGTVRTVVFPYMKSLHYSEKNYIIDYIPISDIKRQLRERYCKNNCFSRREKSTVQRKTTQILYIKVQYLKGNSYSALFEQSIISNVNVFSKHALNIHTSKICQTYISHNFIEYAPNMCTNVFTFSPSIQRFGMFYSFLVNNKLI